MKTFYLLFCSLFYYGLTAYGQYSILYTFPGDMPKSSLPYGSLTLSGSVFYGMTSSGGAHGAGTVFCIDTNGSGYKDLLDFDTANGANPHGSLILSGNVLYGMTYRGGTHNDGVIFSVNTDGSGYEDLLNFDSANGKNPYGDLVLYNNTLYAMTDNGGTHNEGVVFSIHSNGSGYKDLLDFDGTNGANPEGSLTLSGNKLYGMTSYGGANNYFGCIFSIDTGGGGYKDLYDFGGYPKASIPYGSLLLSGNTLYGMTSSGGANVNGDGAVFSIDTAGSGYATIYSFDGVTGEYPYGSLILIKSTLYGMTLNGEHDGLGNIFSVQTNGNGFTNLLEFGGPNGELPYGSLTLSGITLFGMTSGGGNNNDGRIFSIRTDGSGYEDLFDLGGSTNKASPHGTLTLSGIKLYGMTNEGGAKGSGNIFSIDTTGNNYTGLVDFNGVNGANPLYGSLTLWHNKLYGMTSQGGVNNYGVIFSVDTNGYGYSVIHYFNDTDGANPSGSLVLSGNKLYGMTMQGGDMALNSGFGGGVIFSVDTDGSAFQVLLQFNGTDGAVPYGSLILSDSMLYGMTYYGGSNDVGLLFGIDTNGSGFNIVLNFSSFGNYCKYSYCTPTINGNKLYAMTDFGGPGEGNVFSINTNGAGYKDMYDFSGTFDPEPYDYLVLWGSRLYGTTIEGGVNYVGNIFSLDTNGSGYTDMFDFNFSNGQGPYGALTRSGNVFYGMAESGGANSAGLIFRFKDTSVVTSLNKSDAEKSSIMVYPNPSDGVFTIQINNGQGTRDNEIEIYNVLGEKVFSQFSIVNSQLSINMSNKANGIYFYRIVNKDGQVEGDGKFVIQR